MATDLQELLRVSTGLLQTSNAYMVLNGDYTKGKLMEMDGGWGKSSSGMR